jgi:hypothetical protein
MSPFMLSQLILCFLQFRGIIPSLQLAKHADLCGVSVVHRNLEGFTVDLWGVPELSPASDAAGLPQPSRRPPGAPGLDTLATRWRQARPVEACATPVREEGSAAVAQTQAQSLSAPARASTSESSVGPDAEAGSGSDGAVDGAGDGEEPLLVELMYGFFKVRRVQRSFRSSYRDMSLFC